MESTLRRVALACLVSYVGAASGQLPTAEQAKYPAYAKYWTHLALAQAGRSVEKNDANAPMLRRISLAVVIPSIPGASTQQTCVNDAFNGNRSQNKRAIGDVLRESLNRAYVPETPFAPELPAFDDDSAYAEQYMKTRLQEQQQANADTINNVQFALRQGLLELQRRLATPKCNAYVDTTLLVLVQRVCRTSDTRCGIRGGPVSPPAPGNEWADRFDALVQWGNTYRPPTTQPAPTFERAGLLLPDTPVAVGYEALSDAAKQILQNYLGGTSRLTPSEIDPHEPEGKDSQIRQRSVEALVQSLRGTAARRAPNQAPLLGSGVFLVTGTPLEIAVRLSDPGLVRQPDLALAFLHSEPKAKLLHISTDAVAVTRIRNCTQLHGKQLSDLAGLAQCTGYELKHRDEVVACLSGKGCVPAFANVTAIEAGMRIVGSVPRSAAQFGVAIRDISKIASSATLPRISDPKVTFDVLTQRISETCRSAGNGAVADTDSLDECIIRHGFEDKRIAEAYACLKSAPITGGAAHTHIAKCADKNIDTRVLECSKLIGSALASCMIEAQLPRGEKVTLDCLMSQKDSYARASCVLAQKTGINLDALRKCDSERKLECLTKLAPELKPVAIGQACASANTAQSSLDCAEALGVKLPKDLKQAVSCASSAQGSWQAASGCIASKQLGGELGTLADCYVQSSGDGYGAAACYAGRILNLNQDLQMVMQCAVSTGGAAPATAACVFGRFAMRELGNCMGKRFGEGKCFGPNNTLVKTLGIGKNSVVAQLINVQLSILTAAVAFVQNPTAAIDAAIRNFGRELSVALNNVKRELGKALDEARKFSQDLLSGKGVYVRLDHRGVQVGPIKIRWG